MAPASLALFQSKEFFQVPSLSLLAKNFPLNYQHTEWNEMKLFCLFFFFLKRGGWWRLNLFPAMTLGR